MHTLLSLAAVIGNKAIVHSSPLFFSITFFAVLNFCMLATLRLLRKIDLNTCKNDPIKGIVAGCLLFLHVLLHGYAISFTKAAYMISVKRLSILFGILYGGFIFKEQNLVVRFCGAALMLSGAVLIMLKGR